MRIAPYITGQIAGQVNYLGRAFYSGTSSGTSQASELVRLGRPAVASIPPPAGPGSVGAWTSPIARSRSTNTRTEFDQLNVASLNYAVTPELRLSVRGNVETSNLVSVDSETTTGWGGGLRWNPSPRTNLVLEYDQRIFGSSHLYSFVYFAPRSVWAISSVQALVYRPVWHGWSGATGGSTFDLLFAQFATIEPDPVARAQLVNAFIQSNGIDPGTSAGTKLPAQPGDARDEATRPRWPGWATRSTVIFNVFQTQAQALQSALLNPDDILSAGNVITWLGGRRELGRTA